MTVEERVEVLEAQMSVLLINLQNMLNEQKSLSLAMKHDEDLREVDLEVIPF